MATINRDVFIAQFKEEVDDHVQHMTQRLFQLEEQPEDIRQLLEEIFRIAHTLKGSARMMGYADISALAHKMEDLLVEVRDAHVELTPTVTDLLFYCLDTVNYLVEGISKHIKRSANLDEFSILFHDVLAGEQIEIPHLHTQLIQSPGQAAQEAKVSPSDAFEETEDRQYVHIHTADLDIILNLVGEMLINQYRYEGQRGTYSELVQELREHWQTLLELQKALSDQRDRLPPSLTTSIDHLENAALQMFRKSKHLVKKFRNDGQQMRMVVNKLQQQVLDVRMVPASRILHLFPRLVRLTARKLGKQVELIIRGEETRIDTRIIEEMRDPLIHLVQNAVHHGIESPANRQSYGKNPTGKLTISANQEGNRIILSVQDDGQGIYPQQLKEHAMKHDLLSRRDVKSVSDQELMEVLFHPGFSTAETVDDIAGRGFGLNIVRTHVDRVQGEIEVRSQPGKGTEFVIKLPLTLTMMNALLIQIVDDVFALPTTAVEKTFDISTNEIEYIGEMPVTAVDDVLLPVVDLSQLLLASSSGGAAAKSIPTVIDAACRKTVIVLRTAERRIAFLVDELVEEREIVIKHLGPCLKRVRNVAGATTIRGEVIIILSVRDLMRTADAFLERNSIVSRISGEQPLRHEMPMSETVVPRLLLVDDSVHTREVERNILERAGYRVFVAENGRQGLELLQTMSFDLVITDVEMPLMDGLELTKTMKQDELLQKIPVIIISTKGAEQSRQRGLEAGAETYLVKGEFDEQALLDVVDSYLK